MQKLVEEGPPQSNFDEITMISARRIGQIAQSKYPVTDCVNGLMAQKLTEGYLFCSSLFAAARPETLTDFQSFVNSAGGDNDIFLRKLKLPVLKATNEVKQKSGFDKTRR